MIDAVATVLRVQENVFASAAVENSVGKDIGQQTLANIDIGVNIIYRVNGQVQCYGAVTSQVGLEGEVVVILYVVRPVVVFIYIAFADLRIKVGMFGRIDGQGEFIDTVAAVCSGAQAIPNGVDAFCALANVDVFVACPYKALIVAGGSFLFLVEGRGDGQDQGVHTVAFESGGLQTVIDSVSACHTLSDVDVFVTLPYVGGVVAYGSDFGFEVIGRGDGQNQGVHTVAFVSAGLQAVVDGVCACLELSDVEVFVPLPYIGLVVANGGDYGFEVVGRGDGQRKHVNAVAVVDGLQAVPDGVDACRQQFNLFIVTFPNVGFVIAGSGRFGTIETRIYCQIQFEDTVAVVDGLQTVPNGIGSGSQQSDGLVVAFPGIFVIIAGGCVLFGEIYGIDCQGQIDSAVAAERGLYNLLIIESAGSCRCFVETIFIIGFT